MIKNHPLRYFRGCKNAKYAFVLGGALVMYLRSASHLAK